MTSGPGAGWYALLVLEPATRGVQRWRLFAEALQMRGSYRHFARIYFAGMFFNVGLPSPVGGALVKADLAARIGGSPVQRGPASVLPDRAAGLISLPAYGSLASVICDLEWRGIPIRLPDLLMWLGLALGLWLARKVESLSARLPGTPSRLRRREAVDLISGFRRSSLGIRPSAAGLALVAVCSLVNSAVSLWLLHRVGAAPGHPLPVVGSCAMLPLIRGATLMPMTAGGVGICRSPGSRGCPSAGALFRRTVPAGLRHNLRWETRHE